MLIHLHIEHLDDDQLSDSHFIVSGQKINWSCPMFTIILFITNMQVP